MSNGIFKVPAAVNEPVRSYAPGSSEHTNLISKYKEMLNQNPIDVPMYIGGKEVRTSNKVAITPPHDHSKVIGHFNLGNSFDTWNVGKKCQACIGG